MFSFILYNKKIDLILSIKLFSLFFRNESLQITMLDYQNDGAFDVTISSLVPESQLTSRTTFYCELIIPSTPCHITKKFIYSIGKKSIIFLDYERRDKNYLKGLL